MDSRLRFSSVVGIALLSGHAGAVGFGDIHLISRIGEPLRAEVDLIAGGQESVETACFSLAPMRDSDLPAVTSARIQLSRADNRLRLIIAGTRPIADPIFAIGLRASCGVELQRDFVLMPEAPLAAPELPRLQAAGEPAPAKPAAGKEWRASEGETLESIAEALAGNNARERRRILAALRRANPGLESSLSMAEGTAVAIPEFHRQDAAVPHRRPSAPRRALPPSALAERSSLPPRRETAAEPAKAGPAAGGDRLVLGAPPADARPGEKPTPPGMPEMEERVRKMEATLNLLNDQIAKLDQALTLATEAIATQQKLQAAQAALATRKKAGEAIAAAPVPPPVPQPAQPESGHWLEMLLSAIGGGIFASLAALFLTRRLKSAAAANPQPQPVWPLAATSETSPPPAAPAPEPAPADPLPDPSPAMEPVEVQENDRDSLLRLTEIMLSFGRVRDAADALAQYIDEASPDQIQPWTMLLDLYRRGNMPKEFEHLAGRMQERFNILLPTWDEAKSDDNGLRSIEDYPHIVAPLTENWGRQECMDFLNSLVKDNRSGERRGFPLEIVEQIVLLMRVLEDGYGLKRN